MLFCLVINFPLSSGVVRVWTHPSFTLNTFSLPLAGPIIYIEDDEDDQYLMRTAIQELQIPNELCSFTNGETALDFLITTPQKPLLIFCDVNMPIMDGVQLRQRLTENDYLRKKSTPFVFLTTASNPELVRMAYDQTVQGFFTKASSYAGLKTQVSLIVSYWQACQHPLLDEYVA